MRGIEELLGKENVKYNEPMSRHTSFKVGGIADVFAIVNCEKKLIELLNIAKDEKIRTTVIGNGTNLLVADEGIRGIVIKYTSNEIKISETSVVVDAGALNSIVAHKVLESGLSGLEFLAGVPGTIAGAVYMNAGAFGNEIKDVVSYVKYIDMDDLEVKTLECNEIQSKTACENIGTNEIGNKSILEYNKELYFSYRSSIFQKMNTVIIEVGLNLKNSSREEIIKKMDEYKKRRIETQPLDKPSAGSTFKRGDDFISAKLIDEAGLKGYRIGRSRGFKETCRIYCKCRRCNSKGYT